MAIYHFSGDDSSSDNGYWEMIVSAPTAAKARRMVIQELKDQNCECFLADEPLKATRLGDGDGILHSTLQSRCEAD